LSSRNRLRMGFESAYGLTTFFAVAFSIQHRLARLSKRENCHES
jgi:hypothetical protein